MDEIARELEGIRRAIERQGDIAEKTLDAMPRPKNRAVRILEATVLVGGLVGIFTMVDIVRRWLLGG